MLDLARIEAGHLSLSPEPVGIPEVVRSIVDLIGPLAAARGIRIHSQSVDTCAARQVFADRQRFNQILLNLLSNAVKYNRDGGRVDVTCQEMPDGRVRINVSATGTGIPPHKLQQLFQPFERLGAEQSSIEGTGLGLMVSKGLAEAMDGVLGVESELGRGSTFWVELPRSDSTSEISPAQARTHANAAADSGVTGTVLYIEDNVSNRRLMERVFARRPGVRLVGASDGRKGLEFACAHRPDLVLLDLHLPDMNGEDVLRQLKEDPRTEMIPVAVLSADAMPLQTKQVLAAGAAAYLTKPLDVGGVLQFLDETLGERSE